MSSIFIANPFWKYDERVNCFHSSERNRLNISSHFSIDKSLNYQLCYIDFVFLHSKFFEMDAFNFLTIKDIIRETDEAVSIVFEVPSLLKKDYNFKAGQYLTIKMMHEGEELRRSYSLCTTPESGLLKITVKEVEDGTFSAYANNKLKIGDSLEVHTPEGKFVYEPDNSKQNNYLAFAAGSGITPVMSIVKTALEKEPTSKVVLVYGNRTPKDTIFFKSLLELQEQYANRLYVEFVYSQSQQDGSHFGRIEKSTVNFVVKNRYKDCDFKEVFLCGPEMMIESVSEVLKQNDIAEKNIHFELFTSTSEGTVEADLDGQTEITVMLDDEELTFHMNKKESILDAVLDKDLDPPYSCQGGICSSCIARVTEGTAEMRKNQILTDGEVAEGLILTCQAHPTSSSIKVDYDEV